MSLSFTLPPAHVYIQTVPSMQLGKVLLQPSKTPSPLYWQTRATPTERSTAACAISRTPRHPVECGGAVCKRSYSGNSENSELCYQPEHFQPEHATQCSDIEENGSGFDNQELRSNRTTSAPSLDCSCMFKQIQKTNQLLMKLINQLKNSASYSIYSRQAGQ